MNGVKGIVFFNFHDTLIRLDISKIVIFEGDGNCTNHVAEVPDPSVSRK